MTSGLSATQKAFGKIQGLRHFVFGCSKYAAYQLGGKLIRMPLNDLKDEFAFSFATGGWNYYNSIIEDWVRRNESGTVEQSTLWAFYKHDAIRSIRTLNDLLFFHDPEKQRGLPRFYLGTYPWGGITTEDSLNGGIPFGHYYDSEEGKDTKLLWGSGRTFWYDPGDDYTLKTEWKYTLDVFEKLKKGYRPLRYVDYPSIALLIRRDGKRLGLNVDGHHRLAVLGAKGFNQVKVEVKETVREDDIENWYYVKNGYCSKEHALTIFHAFYELDGSERFLQLGIGAQEKLNGIIKS